MRVGAIPNLLIGDLTEIPVYGIYKRMVYTRSKKDKYYTFCTPECKLAIDSYLAYRVRYGESDPIEFLWGPELFGSILKRFSLENRYHDIILLLII